MLSSSDRFGEEAQCPVNLHQNAAHTFLYPVLPGNEGRVFCPHFVPKTVMCTR